MPSSLLLLVLALPLAFSSPADLPGITINRASLRVENDFYVMDGEMRYNFGDEALKALSNGVPLVFMTEGEIRLERKYLWDITLAKARRNLRLQRHALTGQYLVVNLDTGIQQSFRTLEEAALALGQVERLPVIETHALYPPARYRAGIRVRLDIESLPPPLRLVAYLSPHWRRLSSPWREWEVHP